MSPEKIFVSRSYVALCLPEKFWCKPQNFQLGPKSPVFKIAENHHAAQCHMWGQNSNVFRLVGTEILSGLLLSKNERYFELFIENQKDMFLKVVAFLLKTTKISISKNNLTKSQQFFN